MHHESKVERETNKMQLIYLEFKCHQTQLVYTILFILATCFNLKWSSPGQQHKVHNFYELYFNIIVYRTFYEFYAVGLKMTILGSNLLTKWRM